MRYYAPMASHPDNPRWWWSCKACDYAPQSPNTGYCRHGHSRKVTNVAKPTSLARDHITNAKAQIIIKSRMLFNCLRESLTNTYLTSLIVILPTMEEDGPQFLYYMITKTHVTMVLSTSDLTKDINTFNFKKFQCDILKLHAAFN